MCLNGGRRCFAEMRSTLRDKATEERHKTTQRERDTEREREEDKKKERERNKERGLLLLLLQKHLRLWYQICSSCIEGKKKVKKKKKKEKKKKKNHLCSGLHHQSSQTKQTNEQSKSNQCVCWIYCSFFPLKDLRI